MNPFLNTSTGYGKRSVPKMLDRVLPNKNQAQDNVAMGVARLQSRCLMDGSYVNTVPVDSKFRNVAVSFSNNANQISDGRNSDPMNTHYRLQRRR